MMIVCSRVLLGDCWINHNASFSRSNLFSRIGLYFFNQYSLESSLDHHLFSQIGLYLLFFNQLGHSLSSASRPRMDLRVVTNLGVANISRLASRLRHSARREIFVSYLFLDTFPISRHFLHAVSPISTHFLFSPSSRNLLFSPSSRHFLFPHISKNFLCYQKTLHHQHGRSQRA